MYLKVTDISIDGSYKTFWRKKVKEIFSKKKKKKNETQKNKFNWEHKQHVHTMKGWLKNKGTSVKTRRGNGSRRQSRYDLRIGAGAKGRKSLGNHKPKCQRWVAPFHKSKVSKRYHDKAFAKAEIKVASCCQYGIYNSNQVRYR